MAAETSSTKMLQPLLPWLVAFVFGATAWFKLRDPSPGRPEEAPLAAGDAAAFVRDARLWEDPFVAGGPAALVAGTGRPTGQYVIRGGCFL